MPAQPSAVRGSAPAVGASLAGPRILPPPNMAIYDGRHINSICHNAIVNDPDQNHCAHFVCHVMAWNHVGGALKCDMTVTTGGPAVCVRVNEVFNIAPDRETWAANETFDDWESLLMIATVQNNVISPPGHAPRIGTNHRKHVGPLTRGVIWHYSTFHARVFGWPPATFRQRMAAAYGPHTVFLKSGFVRVT